MLSKNYQIISDQATAADTKKKNFVSITDKLKLKPIEVKTKKLTLSKNLDTYRDHQRIPKIQSQVNVEKNLFPFKPVTSEKVLKTICYL